MRIAKIAGLTPIIFLVKQQLRVEFFSPTPGLYDMHGNVWEWCEDIWHENYTSAPGDGTAWLSGGDANFRVLRGGDWNFIAVNLRSANRFSYGPSRQDNNAGGLRLVTVPSR